MPKWAIFSLLKEAKLLYGELLVDLADRGPSGSTLPLE